MKALVCQFLILTFLSLNGFSQSGTVPSVLRTQNTMDAIARGGVPQNTILYGVPIQPGSVVGDQYLDKKWNSTSILLYSVEKLLEGYLTRFDIKGNVLEVKQNDGIRVLNADKIESIVWLDSLTGTPRYFVNAKNYILDGIKLRGLIEVVEDGTLPLFKHTTLYVKLADYNMALDVGSKDDKIIKKEGFYFSINNNLHEFKNKKSLYPAFNDKAGEMQLYIKKNKLSLSKERDMKAIFKHYNSIID